MKQFPLQKRIASTCWQGDERRCFSRRDFLGQGGTFALALGIGQQLAAYAAAPEAGKSASTLLAWNVSVQHYTYRRFSLFEAMEKAAAIGLRFFEVRSNLKLGTKWPGKNADENMPADACLEFKKRLAELGLSVSSVFADFNGKPEQAQRLFSFWKGIGARGIVAEPDVKLLDTLETLCEKHDMRLALHNHQKGKSFYWSPEIVLESCANRSKLLGACADVGQWARSDLDPVECLRKLEGRIHNFHLKDVRKKGDLNAGNTVMGEGQADCANTLKELRRQGYKGVIAIDFEHDTPNLQEDMAKNIAFIEEQAKQLLTQ
jgi:sugar phosphate isomerase/epimerase